MESHSPVTTPTLEDLADFNFTSMCEHIWHGDRVQSTEPASWVLHLLFHQCCGAEATLLACQPCLVAAHAAPEGYWECVHCASVWHGRPGENILAQMRIKP